MTAAICLDCDTLARCSACEACPNPKVAPDRLAAAAPDLLAALRDCERVLSDLPSTSKEGTATRAAWQTVRQAIAKATETP